MFRAEEALQVSMAHLVEMVHLAYRELADPQETGGDWEIMADQDPLEMLGLQDSQEYQGILELLDQMENKDIL